MNQTALSKRWLLPTDSDLRTCGVRQRSYCKANDARVAYKEELILDAIPYRQRREHIRGLKLTYEGTFLRHFTARWQPI